MAPRMAAVLRAPGKLCSFSYVLFVFLLFYVLDVVSITVYDRDTLLNIGSSVAQRKPDFEFLNAGGLFTDTASEPLCGLQKRGDAADAENEENELAFSSDWDAVLSDLLFQPFYWPTFSHWITNSVNCGRGSHTNEKQGTAVLFASQKPGCLRWFQTQPSSSRASPCTARTERKSSQGKAEAGVFASTINNSWCNERNIHSIKSFCSPDLEFHTLLCRPFWLPREFTAIIITAGYIPPQANTDQALKELYRNISEQETTHPDAAFVITGDFNKANFRTIAPKYFQHVTINTRGDRTLDHCYSPSGTHTSPSPAHLSANRITLPFCSCLLIGRNWNVKHPLSGQFIVGQTNRTLYYRTVLITWTGTCSGQRLMTT